MEIISRLMQQFHDIGQNIQGRPLRLRATLVAISGNVAVPTHTDFCYARIHGTDASSLHLVLNTAAPPTEGLQVLVEREYGVGGFTPQYRVVGVWSGSADYQTDPLAPSTPYHADSHQRMSWGERGADPVNVYPRMMVEGRVDPTATPSMGVHIAFIRYRWNGQMQLFPNTTTSNLSAPSALPQIALICFIPAQNDYAIRYGPPGFPVTDPGVGEGECPLASILLTPDTTSIIDSAICDQRDFLALSALKQEAGGEVVNTTINNISTTVVIEASDADFVHNRLRMALTTTLM